jgi:uncharacterized protein involved in response to NO
LISVALISIDELKPFPHEPKFALFALGFRPFFLGAGMAAILLMGFWLALFGSHVSLELPVPPMQWHAHEMLFGYVGAVIAGFLLTAVRNWTGIPTPTGRILAALFMLWLAGRLLPLVPGIPTLLYALVDAALFPAVMIAIARPIIRARQMRNIAFPVMLGMLTVANLLVHAEWLGYVQTAHTGVTLAVYMIVLMMTVMGGRVIPSFTDNKLRTQSRRWKVVEIIGPGMTLTTLLMLLLLPVSHLTALIAAIAFVVHAIRLFGWYAPKVWSVPLLWVLHLGYAWIAIGFLLTALAALNLVPLSVAMHAFTVGAMGMLTLGMMARVALGHTGRTLESAKSINIAFGLMALAAATRVLVPLLLPDMYSTLITITGLLWMASFLPFVLIYAPILVQSRLDGKPG